jgi:hypothetical protein
MKMLVRGGATLTTVEVHNDSICNTKKAQCFSSCGDVARSPCDGSCLRRQIRSRAPTGRGHCSASMATAHGRTDSDHCVLCHQVAPEGSQTGRVGIGTASRRCARSCGAGFSSRLLKHAPGSKCGPAVAPHLKRGPLSFLSIRYLGMKKCSRELNDS